MSDPRWTDETEALVRRVDGLHRIDFKMAGAICGCHHWTLPVPYNAVDAHAAHERHRATELLAALADAGLLLPPAGDTAEQWCIRFGDGTGIGGYSGVFTTEAEARAVMDRHGPGATLMHRTARFWPDRHTHLGWYYPQWQPATQEAPHGA